MSSLLLRDLQKYYDEFHALKPTTLEVRDGEFLVLVGPSGCGKSTLLRMIAGLEDISAGEILIGDTVVNDKAPRDRDVAMVFQNYALYPHRTVRQNLGFSLKLRKADKQVINKRVEDVAVLLELTEVLERYPKQLSGGQRQRVAMGRAIVRDPTLFLFDEPLSNLDAKLRVQMRGEIKELHARLGTTTIYVTHDQIEAMTMADRIVVLNGGVVAQVGEPMEVYKKPADMFVAGFIGSPPMNMFDGTASDGEFTCAGGTLQLDGLQPAGQAVLGLRPEDIMIVPSGEGQAPATVRVVEPTGSEAIIVLDLLGKKVTILHRGDLPEPGQNLSVKVITDSVHLFERDNQGARIRSSLEVTTALPTALPPLVRTG